MSHHVSDSTTKQSVSPANDAETNIEKRSQEENCEEVVNTSAREDEPRKNLPHFIRCGLLEDGDTTADKKQTVLHALQVEKKESFEDQATDEENHVKRKESPAATSYDFDSRNNRSSPELLSTENQSSKSEMARLNTTQVDDRPTVAEETDTQMNIEKSPVDVEKDIFD